MPGRSHTPAVDSQHSRQSSCKAVLVQAVNQPAATSSGDENCRRKYQKNILAHCRSKPVQTHSKTVHRLPLHIRGGYPLPGQRLPGEQLPAYGSHLNRSHTAGYMKGRSESNKLLSVQPVTVRKLRNCFSCYFSFHCRDSLPGAVFFGCLRESQMGLDRRCFYSLILWEQNGHVAA